ncbi:MAG: hypothetical protein K2X35_21590 [Bryobacteraceae bacterium]|nr:hypothetical protein [Bryobacteraceae bacterium]
MKLRLTSNQLRVRLNRGEVAVLGQGRALEERVELEGASLGWSVAAIPGIAGITARFEDRILAVRIPAELASPWAANQEEGLYARQAGLEIAIEKDYECKPGSAPDAFPNPNKPC